MNNKINFSRETAEKYKAKISKLNLKEFYVGADDGINVSNPELIKELIKNPKMLKFSENEDKLLYKVDDGEFKEFDVDISTSFVGSDIWVSNRLIDIEGVFPNTTVGSISIEMEAFYTCINIAAVFSGDFESEFDDVIENYDFIRWEGKTNWIGEQNNFESLMKSWVELGSISIKMLASACSYKLKSEKNTMATFRTSDLPEEVVLSLESLRNKVKSIRLKYEENELSPTSRSRMDKLDFKVANRKMEIEIENALRSDPYIYQLWKLFKISSKNIPASTKNFIRRKAIEQTVEDAKRDNKYDLNNLDNKIYLQQYKQTLIKETYRAWINSTIKAELIKAVELGDKYIAPKEM